MNTPFSLFRSMASRMRPLGVLLTLSGAVLYATRYDWEKYLGADERLMFLLSAGLVVYGAAILLLNYLGGRSEYEQATHERLRGEEFRLMREELANSSNLSRRVREALHELKLLKDTVEALQRKEAGIFSEEEREEIKSAVKTSLLEDTSNQLLHEIEQKYSDEIKRNVQLDALRDQLAQTRERLRKEIDALGRRGNVNLVIGVLTTVVAVSILATPVLLQKTDLTLETLVSHFFPRLTLSFFIEIFSFFFLRLYKTGLEEIKFYQNELTSIECKFVALENARFSQEAADLGVVLKNLSMTDRNHADLQQSNSSKAPEIDQAWIKSLSELIKNVRGS